MAQKPDLYSPHRPVPAKPITQSFPTPNLVDRVLIVRKDSRAGGYKVPEKGAAFSGPDAQRVKDFKFATAKPSDQTGWVDWFYVNERLNQDDYNFVIEYPWVDKTYPRVTRTYVILREDYREPDPDATDPKYTELSLVDVKITRLEDPVFDSLFVGISNVFERVPAPIGYTNEKFESVLPYKFRVAVPAKVVTTVKEGAAQPPVLAKGDWAGSEETNSFNRRTVKGTRRDLPAGGVTFISEKLTRDKQVAKVTESWKDEQQHLTPTPTTIDGEVEQVGDGTTIKSQTETDDVFPERAFSAEIHDPVPPEFTDEVPIRTEAATFTGQASPPELIPGELRVHEAQKDEFNMRREKTSRKLTELPKTKRDYELGGIQTHGSEFGGTLETASTLDNKPQHVEEGFEILASSVKSLSGGLTLRKTTRLFTGGNGTGPYLELIDGGDSYVDDPAVVFDGDRGSGAAGTATISQVEQNPDLDAGGDFPIPFGAAGDNNGVLNFLGKRYNNDVWTNPLLNGTVKASAVTTGSATDAQFAYIADHDTTNSFVINPQPGGGNYLLLDLGVGRALTPDHVAIRGPSDAAAGALKAMKFEVWAFNTFGEDSDIVKVGGPFTLPANGTWGDFALTATKKYRYLRINAANLTSPDGVTYPGFYIPEIEFYGDLLIAPGIQLDYSYNGDENGAFFYLGKRGGGGAWRNPQTNGDISITAPYDVLELGTFDSIVDRAPSNTYLAQRNHAELWFDLGVGRSLLLTTLLFQSRADYGSAMNTVYVQGSADGVTWEENQRLTVNYTAASWTKLDITALTKYYRFFRLILPEDKGWLMLGELEMYGSLRISSAEVSTNYSVTGVNITNGGSNYAQAPLVEFSGGGGSGATGTAVVEDGEVTGVTITNSGTGYSSAPTVAFTVAGQGTGATAASHISGGVVTSIDVVDGGSGYTEVPVVKIVSATGEGATATAVLTSGVVTSINVTAGGSGYALPPTVVLYPATDPEGEADIGFDVDEIVIVDRGSGYTNPPAVHISGSGAEASALVELGFGVDSVQMTNPGDGYTSPPTVGFVGNGSGASAITRLGKGVASAAVTAGGSGYLTEPVVQVSTGDAQFRALIGRPILTIGLTAKGSGYTSDPTVVITGDGTAAAAHVVRSFAIASIAVAAGGSGYTTAPTVVIPAPTGNYPVQATAHAVLTAGVVTSIVIDNPGSGYLTAPTATLTGGDGTGATLGATTLESAGTIDSIVIDNHGTGYTTATISFTGGGGSGATAVTGLDTSVAGAIKAIEVTNPGTDYESAPTLTILPGSSGGTGATATAALSASGRVIAVDMTTAGELYSGTVAVTFTGGGGMDAAGTVVLEPTGKVRTITLVNGGTGFRDDTVIEFVGGGGSGATATATRGECGKVVAVRLTKPGGPFQVAPTVRIVGGQSNCEDSATKTWSALPAMSVPRAWHTTTLLPDGRVLVTGGDDNTQTAPNRYLSSCEIFDPVSNTWSAAASMGTKRYQHGAQLLADGRVIVFSGLNKAISAGATNDTSEIYDPATDTWTPAGALAAADDDWFSGQWSFNCKLLDDRIFLMRGHRGAVGTNQCQIYNPATDTWSVAAPAASVFSDSSNNTTYNWWPVVTLPNGKVLATFGHPAAFPNNDARYGIYDPATDSWTGGTLVGTPYRSLHLAVLLPNNLVYIGSGLPWTGTPAETPLLYNYLTNTFTDAGDAISVRRYNEGFCFNASGKLFIAGGGDAFGALVAAKKWVSVYNPTTDTHSEVDDMLAARRYQGQVKVADGRILVIGGMDAGSVSIASVEQFGSVSTPATAVYKLGSSWPTLIEEQTDPTEGIRIRLTKSIVPALTPLPDGFAESFPLNIYRSIQIVSKIDLNSLPKPESWRTSQHVALPPQLLSVYPLWDKSTSQSTAGGDDTGTNRGNVSASVEVHGAIVITKRSGFRGAALGRIERQFFGTLAEADASMDLVEPTIIQPSSGTIILRTNSASSQNSGLTYDQSPPLNAAGQPAKVGDAMPGGGTFAGYFNFASHAASSGSSGARTQVTDINDVLTAGVNISTGFTATNSSSADVLKASASATGNFSAIVPASTPTIIVPGQAVLAQAVLEKWRFGVYVRHLIYLSAPA